MRVIVTRPDRDAQRWVEALAEHGIDAMALPLIDVRAVPEPGALRAAWTNLADYAAVMFVSGVAAQHFFAARPIDGPFFCNGPARALRAWATGPGTAAALLRCGVPADCIDAPASGSGEFDSEALWAVVGANGHRGARVLIVRGTDTAARPVVAADAAVSASGSGREWLSRQLLQAGAQVDFLAAYERCAPVLDHRQRAEARKAALDGSVWLFTSSQAVANLVACLPRQSWAAARAIATHDRIGRTVRDAGFGVVWQSRPGVKDVVASIESIA